MQKEIDTLTENAISFLAVYKNNLAVYKDNERFYKKEIDTLTENAAVYKNNERFYKKEIETLQKTIASHEKNTSTLLGLFKTLIKNVADYQEENKILKANAVGDQKTITRFTTHIEILAILSESFFGFANKFKGIKSSSSLKQMDPDAAASTDYASTGSHPCSFV